MGKKKKFDINLFLILHRKFTDEKTWTKAKKAANLELIDYLNSCLGEIFIKSKRDNKTTKVHMLHEFTFFRVPEKQKGYLMQYRSKLVMMICTDRYVFNHFLKVYPVDSTVEQLNMFIEKEKLGAYKYFLPLKISENS